MPPSASVVTSIKKGEGEPLTRYDIQYCLLDKIFSNEQAVFTSTHGNEPDSKTTFGELYIADFMASTKLTKILKDKFLYDPSVARKVCMASVVINTGRINTTLVFTPTQARTYNPIPSIQAYGTGHKMLQDAPRLKGILKGSCEKTVQDWEALRAVQQANWPAPHVNPIQLIFLLTSPNTKLDVQHFPDPNYLPHELLSDAQYTSDSRARAWLWLMYHYIETDGSVEAAASNPFGPSPGDLLVPALEPGTEEESRQENIDTQVEQEYSAKMWEERKRYLATVAQRAVEVQTPLPGTSIDEPGSTIYKSADGLVDEFGQPTTRRSSRKIKKRVYESGIDSAEEALLMDPATTTTTATTTTSTKQAKADPIDISEDYKSLRSAQILRHKLARSRHAAWKRRRLGLITNEDGEEVLDDEHGLESAMAREYRLSYLNAPPPFPPPASARHNNPNEGDENDDDVLEEDRREDEEGVGEGGVLDDGWLWNDSEGEEAYHLAQAIRRASTLR